MDKLTTPKQVTSLLYNEMTMEDIANLTDQELIWFHGNLHHWLEITENRINKIKKERKLNLD